MNTYTSNFHDVIHRIEDLQDRLSSQRSSTLRKTFELDTLRKRVEHAGQEIDGLKLENKKYDIKNRALDLEILRMRSRKRRTLRSLSLPEQPRKMSHMTDHSLMSGTQSLRSASWDSVGAKEELDNDRRPSYLSEVISEELDYNSDFETTLQDIGLEEDTKYLKQKIQILERLLKESTSLHSQSLNPSHLMSDDVQGDYMHRADYDALKAQYDTLQRENARLLEERAGISKELDQLHEANTAIRYEVEHFEAQVRELKEQKKLLEQESDRLSRLDTSHSRTNGNVRSSRGQLHRQLSLEEQISGAVTAAEKDTMISTLDEKVEKLAEECEQYKTMIRELEDRRQDKSQYTIGGEDMCAECLSHLDTIQKLQKEMNGQLENSSHKYDRMVDYYDSVLRERAADIEQFSMKNIELQEENSNLTKILQNTVGHAQPATEAQVTGFRRASRAFISGTAPLPRDIDKDQLITQLTNELTKANEEKSNLEAEISDATVSSHSQIEYLENQVEQVELEKNEIIAQIQVKLEDREFLQEVFKQKKREDPGFFRQIISEGRSTSAHEMEEEDLEYRLRTKTDEIKVLHQELADADELRHSLDRKLKKEQLENKELSQYNSHYKYVKDALDQVVKEYCSGGLFPKKPDAFLFSDEGLTQLVTTLYGNQTRLKTLADDAKWLQGELDKQNDDQKTLKIENLEKQLNVQKQTMGENFKNTMVFRCKIQDLEDDLRTAKSELSEQFEQNQILEQDKRKCRERIDETDLRYADLEDEMHQFKKEADEERRQQKGSKLKNLQLHSQLWIQKNRYTKLGKLRDELTKSNELLTEELQLAKDKLEAASLEMVEQQKTSRRVSTIIKTGGTATGKDAIIGDLKEQVQRQKKLSEKLEKTLDKKQAKIRELEDKLQNMTYDRDTVRGELEATFSRMDSEDQSFGSSQPVFSGIDPLELLMDKQRNISVDYTTEEDGVHEQYNEVVAQNEELKAELQEVQKKARRYSTELHRERVYVESVETNYERELMRNRELQDKLEANNRSGYFDNSLPAIQESFEESLYEGSLTQEQVQELLDKLNGLQEDLDKERLWIQHLEEQNDEFRMNLSGLQSEDQFTDEERGELMRKYSETEDMLSKRMKELEEAERTINELKTKLREYQDNELKYKDDIENVSDQLEQALIDNSENELKTNALTVEKTDLQVQVKDLTDENSRLYDKTVALQEEILAINENNNVSSTETEEVKVLLESAKTEVNEWKASSEELTEQLAQLTDQFDTITRKLSDSTAKVETLLVEKEEAIKTLGEKEEELTILLKKAEESDVDTVELKKRLKSISESEQIAGVKVKELVEENEKLVGKTAGLEEEMLAMTEERNVKSLELAEFKQLLETTEAESGKWKTSSDEATGQLSELTQQFESISQELKDSKTRVESLIIEQAETKKVLDDKEKEFATMTRKLEESDIDTVELQEKLQVIAELEGTVASKEDHILTLEANTAELSAKSQDLEDLLEKEKTMNKKNRDLMTVMQREVREARVERQKALSIQVTSEGKIKNIELQCEQKIKMEQQMNEKNRQLMNNMQSEVRRAKADRAILQTELIDTRKKIKQLEEKAEGDKLELEKRSFELEELRENSEVADLQSSMNSIQDAMHHMELRDADLLETLEQKLVDNAAVQEELTTLQRKLDQSTEQHLTTLAGKEATIAALEAALSEEMMRADEVEGRYSAYKNRETSETATQNSPEIAEQECQNSPEISEQHCQSDLQTVVLMDREIQAAVVLVEAETEVELCHEEGSMQTEMTSRDVAAMEDQVASLQQQVENFSLESSKSQDELTAIKSELIREVQQMKEAVVSLELQVRDREAKITLLEQDLTNHKEVETGLQDQLDLAEQERQLIAVKSEHVAERLNTLQEEIQQLVVTKNALQTELDIQLEARSEIDNVIEEKERTYIEIADKYNLEKMEKAAAQETITLLEDDKQQLQNYLLETKKKLEDEMECSKNYQFEASESINDLNNELRRRLLEQSYAHVLSSDSEDDASTLHRPARRYSNSDFRNALEETKSSVKALAKANSKLGRQIEKLLQEKDSFLERSQEETALSDSMKVKLNETTTDKEKLESLTRKLEIELMEKEVGMEALEDNLLLLRREVENTRLMSLKRSPQEQGTLTDLHNLRHRCFMVIPSDPARDLLHMFVSQYRDNLCSNCYARITTLGSRPNTPRNSPSSPLPRKSASSTSDIMLQTDSSLFTTGTDSAYSSSVSIQTERPCNQNVERLKFKTQQLSNDLTDSRRSEKELELALQYQLKLAGDLQKKLAKWEKREKVLLEQISEYKVGEGEAEQREKQYNILLERYRALKEELITGKGHTERLEQELEEIRHKQHGIRSSTPDSYNTPPSNECSLYLSPIANRSESKLVCDRQCDTMSPLILTWADSATQTQGEDDTVQGQMLQQIHRFTNKLCHTLKIEDETLPTLTAAVVHKIELIKSEKEALEKETKSEMMRLQEELLAAKDQLSKTEESTVDLEEELTRVLDFQEHERLEMQKKVKSFASQFKSELERARSDKKLAEDTLNNSLDKICEESNLLNNQHEQSLQVVQRERDSLQQLIDNMRSGARAEYDALVQERNEVERQFFDYKIKSVAEKESLIESQTKNLGLLEKLKSDYERKGGQIDAIQQECENTIENLKNELKEMESREKEKSFELERLQNRIHQYTNKEGDAQEKLTMNQKIIDALKRDVLETRDRLEALAGYEVKCQKAESENTELREQIEFLESTKLTLLGEAHELKEAIESARDCLNSRVNSDRYKNPAIAAVAALWMQEREELNDVKDALQATDWELQELRAEKQALQEQKQEAQEIREKLGAADSERIQLKNKLASLQETKIEAENQAESVREQLDTSNSQLDILQADKQELEGLLNKHAVEKDRLMEDLNLSFREKSLKTQELEGCLNELSQTQDQLFTVKEELIKNRMEAEKLRESLLRAREELDNLESNIGQIKGERDRLAESKPKIGELKSRLSSVEAANSSLTHQLASLTEEREQVEHEASCNTDKLERDIAEILEAFEEYKNKTGTAPEKVQELKHGMAALQETLHQIMNSNSDLNKTNSLLAQELETLKIENENLSQERNDYKHELDNSLLDLSKDAPSQLHSQNMVLQDQVRNLSQRTQRLDKLEHDNTILKNKVRKMKEMLREKEDELINLNESNEIKEDLEREIAHFKKLISTLKHKLDKTKEANIMLKDKVRQIEDSPERFMASTPNHSRNTRGMEITEELDSIRTDLASLRRSGLAAESRVSVAASHISGMENVSLSERCKTLDIELRDMKERYRILQDTHETEQNKAHEMSDALRTSVRILKGYIDRSGDVKGERMNQLQDQLEEQRSQLLGLADQFGLDVSQSFSHAAERESLASGSTVCLDTSDNQLI